MKTTYFTVGLFTFLLLMAGCQEKTSPEPEPGSEIENMEDLQISDNFRFNTTEDLSIRVSVSSSAGIPVKNATISVFSGKPEEDGKLLLKGGTDSQGMYESTYPLPTYIQEAYVTVDQIGIPNHRLIAVEGHQLDVEFGTATAKASNSYKLSPKSAGDFDYPVTYLGGYDSEGVPDYLVEDDNVSQDFLDDINNSLPERVALPVSHPEYLDENNDLDLILDERAEVWVTFIHEGAALKNTLGFYTYNVGNPPASTQEIDSLTIIFPNASYADDGGGLKTGNKVKLGTFDANTAIGWALISNGWSAGQVNSRKTFYSNPDFNPENDPGLKQHTVLLNDPVRDRFIVGFEDLDRSNWSDEDFNDAVFYATTNPVDAPNTDNMPNIDDDDPDVDGDGIPNDQDDFPNDPGRAFQNNYEGSLGYEDLWPGKGDYDFNDIVVDYFLEQITSADNAVTEISGKFILKAHGAEYHNGFGFEMNVSPANIATVEGTAISENYISLAGNGLEAGQENATVIVFDDAYNVLEYPGAGIGVNTDPDFTYVEPDTINLTVNFSNPSSVASIGTPPYNPFIIADMQRGYEIHLADKAPTSLADPNLLGNWEDDSNPAQDRYFKTEGNLPWGIHIAEPFDYPVEKVQIIDAHLKFAEWAQSSGTMFPDWYKDKSGYRNDSNIFTPPQE